ncbi:MAG: TIGR00282 family metallophosphoesterase [Deltaproteobacteria bacterium]|nr:TIGR00282 family metallophosphoesterase [Deltaproteobacteria bacterium]
METSSSKLNILFIGDLIGSPGRDAFAKLLPSLRERYSPDVVIVNGENSAGGFGITAPIYEELLSVGADVITSGNHIWDKKEILKVIDTLPKLIRPANFPANAPGRGSFVLELEGGVKVGFLNLAGRVFMEALECPFKVALAEVERLKKETNFIIVDMHAEATSEKVALGHYLDGKVSAVIGTHTHVQTADEKILAGGTAYITDAGMTGPFDSVIGVDKEIIIKRFVTSMPARFEVASGENELNGVFVKIGSDGKALEIERVSERVG